MCPVHRSELEPGLRCDAGGHVIPVVAGIPRFTPTQDYAAHFGSQWKRYRRTQLDSATGTTITADRLKRSFGEHWSAIRGSQILECGCGAGRFTEVMLAQGGLVTSVDLSEAIEVNAELFPPGDAHRVAQADIRALPFAPRQFDFVVCLGVIQHTPNPEQTIAALFEQVRPGGWLIIDHYSWDIRWYTKSAPLFRMVLKRLPTRRSLRATEWLVNTFFPLHRAVAHRRLARAVVGRISPVLTYHHLFPELDDELQREWALLDTHDYLTDWYKHFRSRSQIRRVLSDTGGTNIHANYGPYVVEARAQRPLG
jgi:2-polyprenyl-3-methyl-5-hydroxy-6-metoxy-1,4-benzoquinol methylase